MADVNTGTSGTLRVAATESATDAAGNWSDIAWALYLIERVSSPATFKLDPVAASVAVAGVGTVWSGTFTFDWRTAGLQSTLIASGTTRVYHDPDGTGSTTVTGSIAATGTSGAGGPSSVAQPITLTTLTVVPGKPSGVTATRVSDSQINLGWTQSSASNGQPTSNTIRRKINGGAWGGEVAISPATAASLSAAANQKLVYGVKGTNSAGDSAWSNDSAPVFTTPAAPTGVSAAKNSSGNIVIGWTPNVGFSEHEHVIEHSTDGGSSWSALTTVAAGTSTYTHVAPSTSVSHKYRVKARNTDTGALSSAWVLTGTVVLLTAPNKPTVPPLGPNVDKAAALTLGWVHNPIDTTGQTAYQVGYSTNGGSSWTNTSKVTTGTSSHVFAANTYTAGTQLTLRVRTWGQATTGGSDGTGASPWSDTMTVTFKTRPVATIVSPANAGDYATATLVVELGFSQAEAATFVSATIELYDGATLLEQLDSTTLTGTTLATPVANGGTYTVKAVVRDSNGLVSVQVTSTFDVEYTEPVAAVVAVVYLADSGIGQIGLTIASPGSGEAEAVAVTITRTIAGETETVVDQSPAEAALTFLDTTPTIHGDNLYRVTTISADAATATVEATLTTAEDEWAFMSKGSEFDNIIRFGGELKPQISPSVDAVLVKAAGRSRPIGLYAKTGDLVVNGTGDILSFMGSDADEVEEFLKLPGKGCYRDPSGRRMFGRITGQISRDTFALGSFAYTVTETS